MTLDEIARNLGVSKSTVSRALSGNGRIGKETKARIVEYMRQQERSASERERVEGTRTLGVILPDDVYANGGPYFQDCILGICETATFLNYDVLIATGNAKDISGVQTLVDKGKVDGIILLRALEDDKVLQYLLDAGFPVGLTGICADQEVIQVDTDNEGAAESLTSFLVGCGYRRFAIFMDNMEYIVNQSRYRGICNGLRKNALLPEKQRVISGPWRGDLLDAIFEELVVQKIECIICCDDIICTRVMSSLQSLGYRIPRDIAVASLYNSPNLDCFSPAVTTVNVSARQVGNMISKQMINYLEGREYQGRTMMDYEILMRRSANGKTDE